MNRYTSRTNPMTQSNVNHHHRTKKTWKETGKDLEEEEEKRVICTCTGPPGTPGRSARSGSRVQTTTRAPGTPADRGGGITWVAFAMMYCWSYQCCGSGYRYCPIRIFFPSGTVFRIRIRISTDPYKEIPHGHGQIRIRIQKVKKPRKCTGSLSEYRTGRIQIRILF